MDRNAPIRHHSDLVRTHVGPANHLYKTARGYPRAGNDRKHAAGAGTNDVANAYRWHAADGDEHFAAAQGERIEVTGNNGSRNGVPGTMR